MSIIGALFLVAAMATWLLDKPRQIPITLGIVGLAFLAPGLH